MSERVMSIGEDNTAVEAPGVPGPCGDLSPNLLKAEVQYGRAQ